MGDFQFAGFFFLLSACAGIFFSVDTLCTNFFVVVFQKTKTLNKGFLKKVVLCWLGMITFKPLRQYLKITA